MRSNRFISVVAGLLLASFALFYKPTAIEAQALQVQIIAQCLPDELADQWFEANEMEAVGGGETESGILFFVVKNKKGPWMAVMKKDGMTCAVAGGPEWVNADKINVGPSY